MNDGDATQDYYGLEVSATLHGAGAGARWGVVEARAVGSGSNFADDDWAEDLAPGACRSLALVGAPMMGPFRTALACEHWTSATRLDQGEDTRTTWRCEFCLTGMTGDRDLPLVQLVSVPEHTLPSWQLSADFGG